MPELPLDVSMVRPPISRLTLAVVESVILFPDDEQWRNIVCATSFQQWRRINPHLINGSDPFEQRAADLMADTLLKMPALKTIEHKAAAAHANGALAGAVLYQALTMPGGGGGLYAIKSRLIEKVQNADPVYAKLSFSKIDNLIWGRYRSVAHFQMAYALLSGANAGQTYPFPCAAPDLPQFLKTADMIRRMAEATPLRQKAGTLLDPTRTWKVPVDCIDPKATSLWNLS